MTVGPLFFLSDVHLRPGDVPDSALHRDLHGLLARVRGEAAELYVLGDLFDFWFEYRHAILRHYLPTLDALAELVRAGVPGPLVPGNPDFWAGDPLAGFGVRVAPGPLRLELQGRRTVLAHGDGIAVREPW